MRSRTTGAAALVAAALLLAGCGSGGGNAAGGARTTVQRYLSAVGAGHAQAACEQLTEHSQERLAEFAKPLHAEGSGCAATMGRVLTRNAAGLRKLAHARILRLAVKGDTATAAVDGVDRPLTLQRDGGDWRIDFTPSVEADKLPGATPDAKDKDADSG